jgi:hypothetical protein
MKATISQQTHKRGSLPRRVQPPRYTVRRIHARLETQYGAIHAADNDQRTRCGLLLDKNWLILTNRIGDGISNCAKCNRPNVQTHLRVGEAAGSAPNGGK